VVDRPVRGGAAVEIQEPTVIERPLEAVWDFCIVHHIENHPRWDPSVELETHSDDPIRVGSVITRRTTRFGTTTAGTMEITELEPMRIMRVASQDGPMRINGWMLFEAIDEGTTRFTRGGDFPDITDEQAATIRTMMRETGATIKELIETER
jgi:hypothetical protein